MVQMHNLIELDIPYLVVDAFANLKTNVNKTEFTDLTIVEEQDQIEDIISTVIDTKHFHYGNLFSHSNPFAIHSDISSKKKSILLIPVDAHVDQKFVVFDQTVVCDHEVSWIYNLFDDKTDQELKDMYYESALKTRPFDTDFVKHLTKMPVDESIYQHLPYSKELYHGLTGTVWDYKPGKALLFPADRIHATGKMQSPKTGCTVQFKTTVDSLEILTTTRILS